MTNRTDRVSPEALVLAHALEKLRAREGVTDSRLINSHSAEATLLLNLAAVHRHAAARKIELAQAAVEVIKECVREDLNGSDSIVADAVLGLGAFSDTYVSRDIEPRVVEALILSCPKNQPSYLRSAARPYCRNGVPCTRRWVLLRRRCPATARCAAI